MIESLAHILDPAKQLPLTFGKPDAAMKPALDALTIENVFEGQRIVDREMARCVLAGMWLYHDYMEQSHNISQEIDTPTGSYWHAILHRREPDYSNAKYWFRRVGQHAIFPALRDAATAIARDSSAPGAAYLATQSAWDPFKFVDLCDTAAASAHEPLHKLCRDIQTREWWLLFEHSYSAAIGT